MNANKKVKDITEIDMRWSNLSREDVGDRVRENGGQGRLNTNSWEKRRRRRIRNRKIKK